MCIATFIDFSSEAPLSFRESYEAAHRNYVLSARISGYSFKIGTILAGVIGTLQQSLVRLSNPVLDDSLSVSIPVIIGISLVISGVSHLFEISQWKNVENLQAQYPHYFEVIPTVGDEVPESRNFVASSQLRKLKILKALHRA